MVPAALADQVALARRAVDDHPAAGAQPALAAFMAEGHLAAHLRRMRRLYAGRQQALLAAAAGRLDGALDLRPHAAGLHLVARFGPALADADDEDLSERLRATGYTSSNGIPELREAIAEQLRADGITAPALSGYFAGPPTARGLLLGYAAVPEADMPAAVARLARIISAPNRASAPGRAGP